MRVLLAKKDDGSFHRLGIFKVTKAGRVSTMRFHGQIEGYVLRSGARTLCHDDELAWIEYSILGRTYRVSRAS